jgi:ketosteroid isomerase-like protein
VVAGRMLTRDEALALFARRRDAWLAGDLDAYLALWADDMRFQSPVHAEPLVGKAAFAELVRHSFAFTTPRSFEFSHVAVAGAFVLAEWTISVERRDGGRRVTWSGMSVAEIQGGLIRWWREYWNPADVL